MFNRLAILMLSLVMALFLSACGDNAEKKVEAQAQESMEKTDVNDAATPDSESLSTKDVQSSNDSSEKFATAASDSVNANAAAADATTSANKADNTDVSSAAANSANQTIVAMDNNDSDRTASAQPATAENPVENHA